MDDDGARRVTYTYLHPLPLQIVEALNVRSLSKPERISSHAEDEVRMCKHSPDCPLASNFRQLRVLS